MQCYVCLEGGRLFHPCACRTGIHPHCFRAGAKVPSHRVACGVCKEPFTHVRPVRRIRVAYGMLPVIACHVLAVCYLALFAPRSFPAPIFLSLAAVLVFFSAVTHLLTAVQHGTCACVRVEHTMVADPPSEASIPVTV